MTHVVFAIMAVVLALLPSSCAGGKQAAGGWLALVRDQRLLVRAPDGAERTLLSTPPDTFPAFPTWSPDGTKIAYALVRPFIGQANANWGSDVLVVAATGGASTPVWQHEQPGDEAQGLAWAPDGRSLLFGYQRTVIRDGRTVREIQRIERLSIANGSRTPVVDGGLFPSMSADGGRLAYLIEVDGRPRALMLANSDGTNARQVVDVQARFASVMYPRIAPDGLSIAFAAFAQQATEPSRARGSAVRRLLDPRMAAPAGAHGFPMEVWRADVADGRVQPLTKFGEDEPYPAWSADSKTLSVAAGGGLYRVNADGSNLRKTGPGGFGMQVDVTTR